MTPACTRADRPRWRRRLAIAVAILALLLGGAVALMPLLVDSAAVRRVVEREISARAGGKVRYDAIGLRLFPLPRAEIRGVTVRIPGVLAGRAAALDVELSLAALLAGAVRPTAIRLERPVFEVHIAPGGGAGDPIAAYRESVGPVVEALARDAPGMSVEIVGGTLDVLRADRRVVSLSKLAVQADVAADAIDVRVSSAADLWRAVEGRIRIAPGSLAGSAKLQVRGVQAGGLLDAVRSEGTLAVHPGAVDARLDVETDGRGAVRATLDASSPQLVLARGARRLELGGVRLAADVARDAETLTVSLRGLELGDLLPRATGSLRAKADGTAPALTLEVPKLDLARLREQALVLAGDVDAVRVAAGIVRAGTLRSLRIASSGNTLAGLAEPRTIRAESGLDAGTLDLPDLGIAVRDGRGLLVFANGALRGSELSGGIGRSSFREGTLALELVPAVVLQDMGAAIDADLGGALAMARRALDRDGVAALADIESMQGRAAGSFVFELGGRRPSYRVDLTSIRANGRYRGVPFPLAVSSGELRYAHDSLRVRGLSGTVGRSRVTGASADLVLDADLTVRGASGDAVLELEELYPWLASLDRLRPALRGVKGVTGSVALRLARLSGPLARPAALDFEATVQPREVRAALSELPAPLKLGGGEANVTGTALRLDRVEATLLDARVTAAGSVKDYASPNRRLDLSLTAVAAGPETLDWLRKRWEIDPAALPRPPVVLDAGRLHWSAAESSEHSVQGTLRLAGDARAEFDLTWGPETVDVRRFALKDAYSDATGSLHWAPSRASLAFSGRIDHRSIARVMARPPGVPARLQGNLRATIDLVEPRRSTVTGTLAGEGLDVLERWGLPVSIERVKVDATGAAARIRDSVVKVKGQRVAVGGEIAVRAETFAVDLHVTADEVDAERLLGAFPPDDQSRPSKRGVWDIPVEGRVAVAAKSIAVAERVVESVAATVDLAPKRVVVDVSAARLCDLSVPLNATLTPGAATVSGRILARDAPLDRIVPCLLPREALVVTGRLDADADYAASGPPGELARRMSGTFRGTGRGGRIHGKIGPQVLALKPVAAYVKADEAADVAARGLAFTEIAVVVTVDPGRSRVQRFTLDSWSLGIGLRGEIDLHDGQLDLRGVVAPFGDVTARLRRVPLLGRLFRTRIVGVPFSVSGDWHDPRVLPLGPEAVAGSLLDLLGRMLNAPIELLGPVFTPRERAP